MAAISNSNINRRTVVMGPFKAEFVWSKVAVSDGSFTSDLQRPVVAGASSFSGSDTSMTAQATVNGRTITYSNLLANLYVSVLVIGF